MIQSFACKLLLFSSLMLTAKGQPGVPPGGFPPGAATPPPGIVFPPGATPPPGTPGGPPLNPGPPSQVEVKVEIDLDRYPSELGWSLRTADTNEVLMDIPAETYSFRDKRISESFMLDSGRSYTFAITDSYGDGICCCFFCGKGSYAIYAGTYPDPDILAEGDGQYGYGEEKTFIVPGSAPEPPSAELPALIQDEIDRCGEIIDAHLHLATWFNTAGPLLGELDRSGISQGLLYSVYGPTNPFGTDPNEDVSRISLESQGRIVGLASLNTTGVWEETRDAELDRLSTALAREEFVGTKLAPPHTCLELAGPIMKEIVDTIAESPSPVLAIHTGTTPFCGPFGDLILGKRGCCEPEFVDPLFLEPLIREYPLVTFVLLHVGSDFLDEGNADGLPNYGGKLADEAVRLAQIYPNVYLEISAFLKKNENGEYERPLAEENMRKIVDAGLMSKVIFGSDVNAFPGGIVPYLEAAIPAMVDAGFTDEERCLALEGNSKIVFNFDDSAAGIP